MSITSATSGAAPPFTRIVLQPRGPFHFGKRGVDLNETEVVMGADAFFSAICSAINMMESADAVDAFIQRFPRSVDDARTPPLRLTSLMPFLTPQGHAPIYLLPRPMHSIHMGVDSLAARKSLKRITWVSSAVFEKIILGDDISQDDTLIQDAGNASTSTPYTVQNGQVWVTASEHEALGGREAVGWQITQRPRVVVDRISGSASAFRSGSVRFAPGAGLYLYVHWDADNLDLRQQIETAVRYLGDSGIGGERSYGYGQFEPSFESLTNLPFALPANASHFVTLAPYLPQAGEQSVLDGDVRYAIVLRRGWLTLPGYSYLRRSTVRMIEAGSVLSYGSVPSPTGYLADATPGPLRETGEYTIYRYGIAWPVPVAHAALGAVNV